MEWEMRVVEALRARHGARRVEVEALATLSQRQLCLCLCGSWSVTSVDVLRDEMCRPEFPRVSRGPGRQH